MDKPLIKICGVTNPILATQAAELGAHWIGIVFHPSSPRFVDNEKALAIARATRKAQAQPVGVFFNHTYPDILGICEATEIDIVQLHADQARQAQSQLPDHYRRIYVLTVSPQGILPMDPEIQKLDKTRDYILIDSPNPGQGKAFNRTNFSYTLDFPWILAGGLNPNNVREMLHHFHPDGVDVSSGVEISKGVKDLTLIQQFIQAIRNPHDQ
jgi:phosphoribosylanthranilate isomerase